MSEIRITDPQSWQEPEWYNGLRQLQDGASLDGVLMDAIQAEIITRAGDAGAASAWPGTPLTSLHITRTNVPEWWEPNGNLLLTAPNTKMMIGDFFLASPARCALVMFGTGASALRVTVTGSGSFLAVGDDCNLFATLAMTGRSTILIGQHTTAAPGPSGVPGADLDARNDGSIVVGDDGMWASGVRLMTDDCHAIRDKDTGERVNGFGGRIVLEKHVWLSAEVAIQGDCWIGTESVVGHGSYVSKAVFPANAVIAGRPAKSVRSGITWTRTDDP